MYGSAHNGGFLVTQVVPDSAAEKAGLQTGDVLVTVDGKPVADIQSIFAIIRTKHLGDTVVVEFLRDGKTNRVEAVLQALRP
jgi:S1-C subfamily serine protease